MVISLQNLVISGVKGLLDVDGIKLIDKDDQAANTCFNVLGPRQSSLSKFGHINIKRP